jgi:hypothetical protein
MPEGAPVDGVVGFFVCKCWVSFGNCFFCNGVLDVQREDVLILKTNSLSIGDVDVTESHMCTTVVVW